MFHFKIIVIAVLIACVLCGEGEGKDGKGKGGKGKWGKAKEKMKQCMQQTKDLQSCCPFPKHEEAKDDPDCQHHLEGIENKEGKEKFKAYSCFTECHFKKQGLLKDDGEIDTEKLKEMTEQHLTKNDALEFKEITMNSIDYCIGEFDAKKEKWAKWAAENKNKTESTNEGEKKCSMLAGGLIGCVKGNIVRNCPESKWEATEECEAFKANSTSMEECMNPHK